MYTHTHTCIFNNRTGLEYNRMGKVCVCIHRCIQVWMEMVCDCTLFPPHMPQKYKCENTHVVCRTSRRLYGMFSQLFLINSFSSFLITLFTISLLKSSVHQYSTFYLLFIYC